MEQRLKIELLYRMKRIRMVEETIARRYEEQQMRCPVHLCTGQEAVAAAVGLALDESDFAVSTHRAHGHYLGKGGNLARMMAEIYGKKSGCSSGKGGSMHLIDRKVGFIGSTAIVGGTIPVGVGLSLSIALQGTKQISCVFLGDGAVEEGVFYESLNFASLKNLPVLFVCENNLYSVYSPLEKRQPLKRKISAMVKAMGVESFEGDGNDAVFVYNQVSRILSGIREGTGPRFFEFFTYRWREHCGPHYDNDAGYRTEEEFLEWRKKDPVKKLEKHLIEDEMMAVESVEEMDRDIQIEIEAAFDHAVKDDFPAPENIFQGVFKS